MHRLVKFIGILIVLGIVSFLICDEKNIPINIDLNNIKISKDILDMLKESNETNNDESEIHIINKKYFPPIFLINDYPILMTGSLYTGNIHSENGTIYDLYNSDNRYFDNTEFFNDFKIIPLGKKFHSYAKYNRQSMKNRSEAIKLWLDYIKETEEDGKSNSITEVDSHTINISSGQINTGNHVEHTELSTGLIYNSGNSNNIDTSFNGNIQNSGNNSGDSKRFYVSKHWKKKSIKDLSKGVIKENNISNKNEKIQIPRMNLKKNTRPVFVTPSINESIIENEKIQIPRMNLKKNTRPVFVTPSINENIIESEKIQIPRINLKKNTRPVFITPSINENIIESEKVVLQKLKINTPNRVSFRAPEIKKRIFNKLNIGSGNRVNLKTPSEVIYNSIIRYKIKDIDFLLYSGVKRPIKLPKIELLKNYRIKFRTPSTLKLFSINKYRKNEHVFSIKKGNISATNEYLKSLDRLLTSDIISSEDVFNFSSGSSNEGLSRDKISSLIEGDDIDIKTLESENDEFLQRLFEKNKDPDVMNLIVKTYLDEYQFIKARKFIDTLDDASFKKLNPSLYLNSIFNSFQLSSHNTISNLTTTIQEFLSENKLTKEEAYRYLSIIALMQKDYDQFFVLSANFSQEEHKIFSNRIKELQNQTQKQKGMPSYYFDVLIGVELFNQGFFQPAKVISLSALSQNSNYILPYQVLGYANFLTNSRDTAIEYFKKLVEIDPNGAEKYRFLMGIAYHWDEKYEQSVVMLSLINNEDLRLDATRYLIRNYLKLNHKNKLINSWSKLLGFNNLTASDFYTYFYETFYRPYSEGKEFDLYAYDIDLAEKMFKVCDLTLKGDEKVVCSYGKIGKNIAIGNFNNLEKELLDLTEKYPQSYLYHALGEFYIKQDNLETAKLYLLKAVSMTQTKLEKIQIKNLLQDIM